MILNNMWDPALTCEHAFSGYAENKRIYHCWHGNRDYIIQYEFSQNNSAPILPRNGNTEGAYQAGMGLNWNLIISGQSGEPLN